MHYHLSGYYGYKNFGDELLLLGVIQWVIDKYDAKKITIEAEDVEWLRIWVDRHKSYFSEKIVLQVVKEHSGVDPDATLVLGGGEVITDARKIPFNGRTYLIYYRRHILSRKYILIGGIGTVKKTTTHWLYRLLLSRAQSVRVRDDQSYKIASQYTGTVKRHDDRGVYFMKFIGIETILHTSDTTPSKIVINVNKHIRNESTLQRINSLASSYPDALFYFFPGQMGGDDTDAGLYNTLKESIPSLQIYNWTKYSLEEILSFAAATTYCIAARLHVLLLFDEAKVSLEPLVYQEKIIKFFGDRVG